MSLRVCVVGAGAVGGYFGGRLAEAGGEVVFLARGGTLRALREEGLAVESVAGDFRLHSVAAEERPADVGPVDLVLVAVKSWQLEEVAPSLPPLLDAGTGVLPLLNGVEAPEVLCRHLGREHVLGGLARIISFRLGPARVRHAGASPTVVLGELDDRRSDRVRAYLEAFRACRGVAAEVPASIQAAMWEKFLFIAPTSGLGAVTRMPVGVLRQLSETRELLRRAMDEIVAVAAARGVSLEDDVVDRTLAFVDSLPADGTASMQRDILEGRPSELEAQNGAVVRLGSRAGVETPVNDFFHRCLLPAELVARGRIQGVRPVGLA